MIVEISCSVGAFVILSALACFLYHYRVFIIPRRRVIDYSRALDDHLDAALDSDCSSDGGGDGTREGTDSDDGPEDDLTPPDSGSPSLVDEGCALEMANNSSFSDVSLGSATPCCGEVV